MSNEIKKLESPAVQWPAIANKEELKAALVPELVRQNLRKVDTPMKAYQSDAPTLALIAKEHGEKFCKARLYDLLLSLGDYLGSQFDLNARQLSMLVEDIVDEFYAINIADVQLVLRRIQHGECGKIYGKITCAFIFDAFKAYYQERANDIADSRRASEESIAKHGFDRTHDEQMSLDEISEHYLEAKMAAAEKEAKRELIEMNLNYKLSEVKARFNHAAAWHNELKNE